jgi:hypothetical protein
MLRGSRMLNQVFEVLKRWLVRADLLRCEYVIEFDPEELLRRPEKVVIDIG